MSRIHEISQKLTHPIQSIRLRALKNLSSKLQHDLVNVRNEISIEHLSDAFQSYHLKDSKFAIEVAKLMNYVLEKDPTKSSKLRDLGFETYVQRTMKKIDSEVLKTLMKRLLSVGNILEEEEEESKTLFFEPGTPFVPTNAIRAIGKEEAVAPTRKLWRFPSIQLTTSDERVLFELGVKFKMLRPDSIREALYVVLNQVLEGFPAEVLLQHANLFEHVVASISLSPLSSLNDDSLDMDLTRLGLKVLGLTGKKLMESVRLLSASNTTTTTTTQEDEDKDEERIPEANRRRNRWRYPTTKSITSSSSKLSSIPLLKATVTAIVASLCLMKSPRWIDDAIMCVRFWIPLLSTVKCNDMITSEIMTALADAVAIHEQHISNILLRGEITSEGVLSLLMFLPELMSSVPHDKSTLPRILKSLLLRVVSSQWLNEFQPSVRSELLMCLEDRSASSFRDNLDILKAINQVKTLKDFDLVTGIAVLERAVQGLAYVYLSFFSCCFIYYWTSPH